MKGIVMFRVLCTWKWRLCLRSIRYEFLRTLQGKIVLFVLILSLPAFWRMLASSLYSEAALSGGQLRAVLLLAHCFLTLSTGIAAAATVPKVFVLKGPGEPLFALSFCLRELAAFRLTISVFLPTFLYMITLFYVFHRLPLLSAARIPTIALVIHPFLLLLFLFATVVTAAALVRPLLLTPRTVSRATLIQGILALPFLASIGAMSGIPVWLQRRNPILMEAIGDAAEQHLWLFQMPLAITYAFAGGRYLAACAWFAALAAAFVLAVLVVRRWVLGKGPREIILDFAGPISGNYPDAFSHPRLRWPFGRIPLLGLFWIKDILLAYRRSPMRYVQLHAFLLSTLNLFLIVLYALNRASYSPSRNRLICGAAIITVAAALAMLRCLNSLGMEGSHIACFRPVFSCATLFAVKTACNFVFCLGHSTAYSLVAAFAWSRLRLSDFDPVGAAALAVFGTAVFVGMGMTLAFLFPDMKKKAAFLAGASGLAKNLYVAGSAVVGSMLLGLAAGHASGQWSMGMFLGSLFMIALPVLACCSALSFLAVKRLGGQDI